MQLTATPVTNRPEWREPVALPTHLPTAPKAYALRDAPSWNAARTGHRNSWGTDLVQLGADGQGWITHGTFDQAVAAARDLSASMPSYTDATRREAGTVGILQGHDGWLLLRAGRISGSWYGDDQRLSSFVFAPDVAGSAPVVRRTKDPMLALVGPESWIDFRTSPTAH